MLESKPMSSCPAISREWKGNENVVRAQCVFGPSGPSSSIKPAILDSKANIKL
jgi:hypothetical protein